MSWTSTHGEWSSSLWRTVAACEVAAPTRGVEELRVLTVPAGIATVRFTLEFEAPESGPYTAVLRTVDRATILRRTGLAANRRGQSSRLTLDVPADRLAAVEYNLAILRPVSGDVVADCQVRVSRDELTVRRVRRRTGDRVAQLRQPAVASVL